MLADDGVRLQHMVDAGDAIAGFMAGRTQEDLGRDQMLLFAVTRAVEIIGEAAARLTEATRAQAPHLPWTAIVSMRNRLIHGYFDVDPDIVWRTVSDEIPALLPHLRDLLASADPVTDVRA